MVFHEALKTCLSKYTTSLPIFVATYLGLQYVYESLQAAEQVHSVYLSGNGPLVKVLSAALGSNVFVNAS